MTELARGAISDRPWGRTLGALGLRGLTGELTVHADGKQFKVAFSQGVIVAAHSPLANDAAVRLALTSNLVTSSQVADITRKMAAMPDRDEIELLAELARLSPEHAQRLRRRLVAQRAARTFSLEHGDFVVDDTITLPVLPGSELDIRTVMYLGARNNLSEERLAAEVAQMGAWFQLKQEAIEDLPLYGFTETEKPILQMLVAGASLVDLERENASLDARTVRAVVYSLVSCAACEVRAGEGPAVARTATSQPSVARTATSQSSVARTANPQSSAMPAPSVARTTTSQPSVARAATSQSSVARTANPQSSAMPTPSVARTATSQPSAMGTPAPGTARTATGQSPMDPTLARTATGQSTMDSTPARTAAGQSTMDSTPARTATGPGQSPTNPTPARTATGQSPVLGTAVPAEGRTPTPNAPSPTRTAAPRRARRNSAAALEVEQLLAEKIPELDRGVDHFTLLGVNELSTPTAIREAYFALARKLHPDRLASIGVDDPDRRAQRLMAQVNAAFAVLNDAAKRDEYVALQSRGGEAAVAAEQARADEMTMRVLQAEEAFKQGEMALRRDQLAQAIASFQTAVELQPNESEYQALLAWAQFAAAPDKNTVAAATRRTLQRAADINDRSPTAKFYLGRVERMLGREREALQCFQDVLRIRPNHPEAASEARVLEQRLKTRR